MNVKQISVFLENKPGRLTGLTRALSEAGINIRALSLADTTDFGIMRLIVDRPEEALKALQGRGYSVAETDVLAVEIPDRPGGLAHAAETISAAGINIEYMYAFVEKKGGNAVVVFRVDDLEATAGALAAAGIPVLPPKDVYNL
ncbi:MAG TPA: ACT domain-containing protein [bacterium]|nr:ACT domain-containing protein [bacterium]HPQ67329.1 ACT domain-containing protein [bacterium]